MAEIFLENNFGLVAGELRGCLSNLGNINAYFHLLPSGSMLERSDAEMWVHNKPNTSDINCTN